MERVLQKGGYQATYQVLLVRVIGMEQVDEPAHQALLFSKVLRVRVLCRLIWLVLDQCGHQAQDGVHLHAQTGRGLTDQTEDNMPSLFCKDEDS